ncbi:MAG: hypothetical protein ACJARZ_002370, partial [Dokdonia sp.]
MKRLLLLLSFFCFSISYAQITVDNSFTTLAQVTTLLEDVLIGSSSACATISNVTKRTGLNTDPDHEGVLTAPVNGIGSFDANGSAFPFQEGIILMSGDASTAPGPNTTPILSAGGADQGTWDGDDDLNAIIGLTGVDPNDTYNATFVTFDFTPNINFIDFNFIFASEEYDGGTECGFNDAFAFILTDLVTGIPTNLAIVPGTTDPISTFSIRDLPADPPPCPDVNPSFFDRYNQSIPPVMPDPIAINSPIALNGQTIPLSAQSIVVPGRTYNIKLVVADQGDAVFDIAVFLEAGSFNIGVDLGDDLTVMDDTALCDGDTATFDASPGTTSTTGFEWQFFNIGTGMFEGFVPAITTPIFSTGVPGEYKVLVTFDSGCTGEDTIIVEIFNPPVGTDTTDTVCSNVSLAHDLTADVSSVSTFVWKALDNPDPNVTGEQITDTPTALIDDVVTNTSAIPQIVRYEVQAAGTGPGLCPAVAPFFVDVTVNPQPTLAATIAATVCSGEETEITLAVAPVSAVATTYNLLSVTPENASVVPVTGNAAIGTSFPSTHIFADAFTNITTAPLWVEYEVVPVSALGCLGDPVIFRLTVNPEPVVLATLNNTACSDTASGIILATNNTAAGAASYAIDINFNGLTASAGAPVPSGTGFDTMSIADDAYTNTGMLSVVVTYTVIPVSADGCLGEPHDILLTVDPEPVVATNLNATVCSDSAIGVLLNTNGLSIAAATYNLVSSVPTGVIPNPANAMTPTNGVADIFISTDAFTNATATVGFVDYVVEGVSAAGCIGELQTIRVTINPEPVLSNTLEASVCSDEPSGITLAVEGGSFAATTYDITVITNPASLAQSAGGLTTVGTGYVAADIANDAYTNTGTTDEPVIYTVVPVSVDGCKGEPVDVVINVLAFPVIVPMIPNLDICDDVVDGSDTNGMVEFNLTDRVTDLLGGQTNVDVAYFEDAGLTIPIPVPTAYYSNSSTIFVTLTRNDVLAACAVTNSFDIFVRPKPVILTPQAMLVQCDTDIDGFSAFNLTEAEIFISADFMNETFSYFDPMGTVIPDPTDYTNQVVTTEIVSVTVTTAFGCERNSTILLEVDTSNIPVGFLLNFQACDTDFDEEAIFDFSSATPVVIGLFPPGQVLIVSYYETEADALAETNPILDISNFQNDAALTDDITGIQPIWIRVDGDSANDCQGLGIHINLLLLGNPTLEPVSDLIECRDIPGTFTYDLTQKNVDITAGDATVQVIYYDNIADYNATPPVPLPSPTAYMTSSLNQVIFYSTMNTAGCTTFDDSLSFQLIVNPNPEINDIPDYNFCGEVITGTVTLDLSLNNSDIILGNTEAVTVSYHTSQTGGETGDLSIPDATSHTTTAPSPLVSYTEIVWIRVTDDTTGCFKIIDFDINILLSPAVVAPPAYEICDEDNDGFAVFELGTLNPVIFAGDPTLTIEYYFTQSDAINTPPGLALDQTAYPNVLPFNDSVWARVENAADCETIFEVLLVVLNAPVPNSNPEPYVLCDTNNDGVEIFDLTSREIEILGGLDPAIYDIVWYSDEILAMTNTGIEPPSDIADEVNFVSTTSLPLPDSQMVYARVINTTQSPTVRCFEVVTLTLEVEAIPTPDQPAAYELCDDLASGSTTDEISIFDLRSQDIIIAPSNPN